VTLGTWTVRLSITAEADYDEIPCWTAKRFGAAQTVSHGALVGETPARLERGPAARRDATTQRDRRGSRTLHPWHHGRHFILFHIASEPDQTIDVLRIEHDAVDLARHVERED
jgi:plasmid stabilization system protein ParE